MIVEDYCVSQDQFVKGLFVSKQFCILKGTKVRNERERAGDQKMMHFFHLTLLQMQFHKGNASSQDKATAFDQQLLCVPPFFYAFDSSLRISGCFLQHANLGGFFFLSVWKLARKLSKTSISLQFRFQFLAMAIISEAFFSASAQNGLLNLWGLRAHRERAHLLGSFLACSVINILLLLPSTQLYNTV